MFRDERLDRQLGKAAVEPAALARAIAELEAYHRQPIAAIAQRYWDSPKAPSDNSARGLIEFYRTSDRYLYESAYTEGYADHQRMRRLVVRAVGRWRLAPVLDFGGGAGGLTLALAERGFACEYADVPGKLSEFFRWRLARRQLSVPVLDATQPLSSHRYGAVLAVDVLEHVPDLAATLRQLKKTLAPSGRLIGTHSFSPHDPLHLPSSHRYGDLARFDRLMREEGFHYLGRLKPDFLSEQLYRWTRIPVVLGARLSPKLKGGGNLLVYRSAA